MALTWKELDSRVTRCISELESDNPARVRDGEQLCDELWDDAGALLEIARTEEDIDAAERAIGVVLQQCRAVVRSEMCTCGHLMDTHTHDHGPCAMCECRGWKWAHRGDAAEEVGT